MLKPYETKLNNVKTEIQQIGISVIEALEVCLKALNDRKIEDLTRILQ